MAEQDGRLERIRPCMKCGTLLPFSALKCTGCQASTEGAARDGERVRSCLSCGIIVTFDQDPCPACGAPARVEEVADERIKECAACGSLTAYQDLYCDQCGDLSIDWEEDEIAHRSALEAPEGRGGLVETGFGGLLLLGLVCLLFASLGILL